MEISLLQAFALGLLAFIAGPDMFNGLTHMHRPVVLGPLVGLILGDLHTGILTGGTLELVWMGLAPLRRAAAKRDYRHHRWHHICHYYRREAGCRRWGRRAVCRGGSDGDHLPLLGDVRRDVPLRSHGG